MSGHGSKYGCDLTLVAINLVGDSLISVSNSTFDTPTNSTINDNACDNGIDVNGNNCASLNGNVLGFVTLRTLSITLNDFREMMRQQIQTLPNEFIFLSKEGWVVSRVQETNLMLYYLINDESVVNIRRFFDKQRFGVIQNDATIGFIFADMENTGNEIRKIITTELSATIGDNSFKLIDRNNWPITVKQENLIKVWDLMHNGSFRINLLKRSLDLDITDFANDSIVLNNDNNNNNNNNDLISSKRKKRSSASTVEIDNVRESVDVLNHSYSMIGNNSETSSIITPATSSVIMHHALATEVKPILISYVRAEAEQHARQLKSELTDLGCRVFLDVDEIEGGHDWQDALNNAVLNCHLFVPLITPQYGYTQWTNREVKLADIKQKPIIPISFLDYWPPECLAIQFASTQYIPWKKQTEIENSIKNGEGDRANDIRFWDQPYVRYSAKIISDSYLSDIQNMQTERNENNKSQHQQYEPMSGYAIMDKKSINDHEVNHEQSEAVTPNIVETMAFASPKQRMSIVISSHPKQREFVHLIRDELSKLGFDVWSSTDMSIGTCSGSMDYTQNGLSQNYPSPITTPVAYSLPAFPTGDVTSSDQICEQTMNIGGSQSESSQDSAQQGLRQLSQFMRPPRLRFSLSNEQINYPNFTQITDFGCSQLSIFSPEDLDKAKSFRERADAARIVILVLSKSYYRSRTCKQQAFYCDFRKKVIAIKYDDAQSPHWLSKLFDDELLIRNSDNDEQFLVLLKQRVQAVASESRDIFKSAMSEARVHALASYVSKNIPIIKDKKKVTVYVAGSTKFFCPLSESICRAIGQALASMSFVVCVTGGFYGIAETIGRSFCEERELVEKPAHLYHILPRYDSMDLSLKARQNNDGTFQRIPFGNTVFIGDSFQDRDSVVARLFSYCILIEGGPRSARIAEEFMWNDNIVIPIMCTGGAAAGHFDLPTKIHDVPMGVHKDDWSNLMRRDVTAENIADAVKNIICCLVKCRFKKKGEKHTHFRMSKNKILKLKGKGK